MSIDEKALAAVKEKWGSMAPVTLIINEYEAAKLPNDLSRNQEIFDIGVAHAKTEQPDGLSREEFGKKLANLFHDTMQVGKYETTQQKLKRYIDCAYTMHLEASCKN